MPRLRNRHLRHDRYALPHQRGLSEGCDLYAGNPHLRWNVPAANTNLYAVSWTECLRVPAAGRMQPGSDDWAVQWHVPDDGSGVRPGFHGQMRVRGPGLSQRQHHYAAYLRRSVPTRSTDVRCQRKRSLQL